MYKLLLVDDRPIELRVLRNITDWEKYGVEIVGAVSNGQLALDFIRENTPDIILTDIAMPVMNGIELTRLVKSRYSDIRVIFLSVHEDFAFAKSAIDLYVDGYVLKPVLAEDLEKVVSKIIAGIEASKAHECERREMLEQMAKALPLVQEQFIKELLLGNFNDFATIDQWLAFLSFDVHEDDCFWVASVGVYQEELSAAIEDKYFLTHTMKKMIHSYNSKPIAESVYLNAIQMSENEYAILIIYRNGVYGGHVGTDYDSGKKIKDESQNGLLDKSGLLNVLDSMYYEIIDRLKLSVHIGLSKNTKSITEIPRLYEQAKTAEKTRFYGSSSPVVLYESIEDTKLTPFEGSADIASVYKEIKALISYGDENDIEQFLQKFYGTESAAQNNNPYNRNLTFTIINISAIVITETGETFNDIFGDETAIWNKLNRFETIPDVKQWLKNIIKSIHDYLDDKNAPGKHKISNTVKSFIHENYNRELTITSIAKHVFLSPSRCSALFKQETGITIGDYLLSYRIEIAKKLLLDPNVRTSAVAEMIGYNNQSYFTMVFKKITGLTPAKYKGEVRM